MSAMLAAGPLDVGAVSLLAAAIIGGYPGWRLMRANRRKIVAETANVATQALERALERYEDDNDSLRKEVRAQATEVADCANRIVELERRDSARAQELVDLISERNQLRARLADLDRRIGALVSERDGLRERVGQLERRLADAGITDTPDP